MLKIPKYSGAGIYALINAHNKKIYIGRTNNIEKRAKRHRSYIRNENHSNSGIRADSKNHKDFAFIVLEKTDTVKNLKNLELLYMLSFVHRKYILYNNETEEQAKSLILSDLVFSTVDKLDSCFKDVFNTPSYTLRSWNPYSFHSEICRVGMNSSSVKEKLAE